MLKVYFSGKNSKLSPKDVLWIDKNVILLVSSFSWKEDRLTRIHFDLDENSKEYRVSFVNQCTCSNKVWQLITNSKTKSIFLILETGLVKKYVWSSNDPQSSKKKSIFKSLIIFYLKMVIWKIVFLFLLHVYGLKWLL